MKTVLLALLLAPLFSYAQTLALLDRKLMAPMVLSDNTALDQVESGYFPVYLQDLDSVIRTLEDYCRRIDQGRSQDIGPQQKTIGHSSFYTDIYNYGPRDRYRIVFSTSTGDYKTSMVLVYKDL